MEITGTTKICSTCGDEKEIGLFRKNRAQCKSCHNKKKTETQKKNPEKVKERNKLWREKNKEYVKVKMKEWYDNNKEWVKEYNKTNKDKINQRRTKHYVKNRTRLVEISKKYKINNKQKVKINARNWYQATKVKNRKRINQYIRNKILSDPFFKLKKTIRTSISKSLKRNGYTKKSKSHEILGCSYDFFKIHIESQWSLPHNLDENGKVWMNWSNHGKYNGEFNYGWDIDHMKPLSSAKTEEELLKLNHYTNLQPLCSHVNRDIKIGKILG